MGRANGFDTEAEKILPFQESVSPTEKKRWSRKTAMSLAVGIGSRIKVKNYF